MKGTKPIFIFSIISLLVLISITLFNLSRAKKEDIKYDKLVSESLLLNDIQHNTSFLAMHDLPDYLAEKTLPHTSYDSIAGVIKKDVIKLRSMHMASNSYSELGDSIISFASRYTSSFPTTDKMTDSYRENLLAFYNKINDRITYAVVYNNSVLREILYKRKASDNIFATVIAGLAFIMVFLYIVSLYLSTKYKRESKSRRELEKFNSSLLQNIYDPIIALDKDKKIITWNKHAEELYDYKDSEVINKHFTEFLQIEYPFTSEEEIDKSIKGKNQWRGEVLHRTSKGKVIPVAVTRSIIYDEKDNITGYISVIRDISSHKAMEEKLLTLSNALQIEVKKKSGELQSVFERVADAFIALDEDLNYTYLNKKALELHGLSEEEIIGKHITDVLKGIQGENFYESLVSAVALNKNTTVESYSVQDEKWYENLIYPSADGVSIYYRDITESKNAKINLNITNERLRSHFHNTPMGVIECGNEEEIILWNKRAEEIFKIKADDALGHKITDLPIFKDNPLFAMPEPKQKTRESAFYIDMTGKEGCGSCCKFYISNLYNKNGKRRGQLFLIQDVTESKKIEEELKEAESKFRSLVEQSMVGVYILQDYKIAYANPAFAALSGFTRDELLSFNDWKSVVHKDDLKKIKDNIKKRISGEVNSIHYSFRGIKKDGTLIHVEVFGSLTMYNGKPAVIGSMLDITKRIEDIELLKKNEADLKLYNERFMLAAQATMDAVWDWNLQENSIWGNEQFCKFMDVDNVSHYDLNHYFSNIHPDDRQRVYENFVRALKTKQIFVEEECKIKTVGNEYSLVRDKAYIIYDEKGRAIRMVGAFQDITLQKRNEQKILREKQLSDSIINSLPSIFLIVDKNGKLRRWNKNYENFLGLMPHEISSTNVWSLFNKADRSRVLDIETAVQKDGYKEVEILLKDKDGVSWPYFIVTRPLVYEGDDCIVGVGIDISERVKYERKLRESEGKYRSLIQQAADGIFICDNTGKFSNINDSIASLSYYKKDDILDMNIDEVFILEEGKVRSLLNNLAEGQGAVTEGYIKQKDGNLLSVEISFQVLNNGLYQGIARNISGRKQAEMELIISESKYRLLFNKNPLPLFIVNTNTQEFLDVNYAAEEFYGYSRKEFQQLSFQNLSKQFAESLSIINIGSFKDDLAKGKIHKQYTKSGTQVFVKVDSHNIMYENQSATLIVAIDETEKLSAQEHLQQSHASLRQLALHLEHIREAERTHMAREIHDELGQQLTGLKMDVSWVYKKLESSENMEDVKTKVKTVVDLINETVITVRKLATKLRPSILDDLGLIAALEWQTEEFEKRSEIKATFITDLNAVDLEQSVVTNIFRIYQESLTNVSRHAQATIVESSLLRKENTLALEIKDNGRGFNINLIESKKTLGLLGMNERVLLLGGQYHIYSSPGKGTLIRITIPLPHNFKT